MGKKKKARDYKAGNPYYWETEDFNNLCYITNIELLESLAMNRFRWVGLPDTCDARFLEQALLHYGIATIAYEKNLPGVWLSLMAMPNGDFNIYGLPTKWRAKGWNQSEFKVTPENGELVYYSQLSTGTQNFFSPWTAIRMYANKLTQYQRTEDVNLFNARHTQVWVAPQEKKLELQNILKQHSGFEPAVLGDKSMLPLKEDNVFKIDCGDELIVEELGQAYQNTLNQFLLFMGIPHLAFEKGERMIEDEARANTAASTIMLKNCLDARRAACDRLRRLSDDFADTNVYFNDDWESYNFNYANNLEQMAQDGLLGGTDDGRQQLPGDE